MIRLQKSSARRTFVTLLSGFVFVVVLVFAVKISLNYIGVCTRGPEFWRWHRISNAELIAFLELKGTSNAGVQTEYSVAEPYSVPGDHYQPASFIDKIAGAPLHWRGFINRGWTTASICIRAAIFIHPTVFKAGDHQLNEGAPGRAVSVAQLNFRS
ncbi:hypothetical protein LZK76_11760 [Rhizobium leguminosarum]|nr:hypothetical protein LZK76_11760 [Rhizobium leguminosarum]